MPRLTRMSIPINPAVLQWALAESGHSEGDLAERIGAELSDVRAWLSGAAKPNLGAFRRLASVLRRPTATFFLPAPPKASPRSVSFRPSPGSDARPLFPEERLRLREVERLQDTLGWVERSLGEGPAQIPRYSLRSDQEVAASKTREHLGVSLDEQVAWTSPSAAFRGWREALERTRILVFSLPIGSESARGFSIWDDESPLVAVNTAYNPASRVFTLFHELGHLVTRTNSICVEDGSRRRMGDGSEDVERWCEGFSASLLMPRSALESLLAGEGKSVDLKVAGKVSRHFNVSLRAAVIRLIDLGRTNWGLYRSIPTSSDGKHGGGGGKGRNLAQRRLDEYGTRTPQLLMRAWKADLLDPVEVMQRLDVTWEGLEGLRRRVGS